MSSFALSLSTCTQHLCLCIPNCRHRRRVWRCNMHTHMHKPSNWMRLRMRAISHNHAPSVASFKVQHLLTRTPIPRSVCGASSFKKNALKNRLVKIFMNTCARVFVWPSCISWLQNMYVYIYIYIYIYCYYTLSALLALVRHSHVTHAFWLSFHTYILISHTRTLTFHIHTLNCTCVLTRLITAPCLLCF